MAIEPVRTGRLDDVLHAEGHDIYVLTAEEALRLYVSAKVQAGALTPRDANQVMRGNQPEASPEDKKALSDFLFDSFPSHITRHGEAWRSAAVVEHMIKHCGGTDRIMIRENNGRLYAVFKGCRGLRKIMEEGRHFVIQPRVIALGIVSAGRGG